jgi:glucokinase
MSTPSFAIGLDLGGTNARAAAVDVEGRILQVKKKALTGRTPEAAAEALAGCAARVLSELGATASDAGGFGLALAGQIDARTGRVIVAPNLHWRDVDFAALLSERIGALVRMGNDLAVAALGEARAGAARGFDTAVLVFVGSGVGSGLILNGKLFRGARGLSGELGHTKVRPGGRLCGCGERGCLEAYAGGNNLGARAAEAIAEGRASSLKAIVPAGLHPTASMIDRAADEGDALSIELRNDAVELIGVAAANLITELNPDVLILGGGVLLGSPTIRRMVEEVVRGNAGRAALSTCAIVDPVLGDDAGVIGGAFLARAG